MNKNISKINAVNFLKICFVAALFILSAPVFSQEKSLLPKTTIDNVEFYIYEITTAEGFYSVSKKFGISEDDIIKYNPETKSGLKLGQRILIPTHHITSSNSQLSAASDQATTSNKDVFTHTVIKGETLHSISRMYHVSVNEIKALNPNISNNLRIGQVITIPQKKSTSASPQSSEYIYHTIQPKETLYAVAKLYNSSMQEVIDANPGLSNLNFSIGKIIRIKKNQALTSKEEKTKEPTYEYKYYKVSRKDTYYSIAKKFNIDVELLQKYNPEVTKLRSGRRIVVPILTETKEVKVPESKNDSIILMNRLLTDAAAISGTDQVDIAILLPFDLNQTDSKKIRENRYIEFYEGFLLAVDKMRYKGSDINLHVYDTKTIAIMDLIAKPELKQADLIIGPVAEDKLQHVAQFAKHNKINMVNPFSFDSKAIDSNPYLYQVNTPTAFLNAESTDEFIKLFGESNIVFLKDKGLATDKKEFIDYLRAELSIKGIKYKDYEYSTSEEIFYVDSLLNLTGKTVFVPLSAKKAALDKILPSLTVVKRNNSEIDVTLFGYPEWQMYSNQFMDYYYSLNTYIYTRIYVNPFDAATAEWHQKYKQWYQKDLLPIYPCYGILGYDTGMFFIDALTEYGRNFDNHIEMKSANSLQTAMCFRRVNNWGGFINRCIYFVNFRPDGTIVKTEVK